MISGRVLFVPRQEPFEPFLASDAALAGFNFWTRHRRSAAQRLMRSMPVLVINVLNQDMTQRGIATEEYPV